MPNSPLNPDGIEAAARAVSAAEREMHTNESLGRQRHIAERAVTAYLAALPATLSCVEHFINERPGYITALKETRGTDDQSDYHRWQGHAEARRQLAQTLGWTVPHNPDETTTPEES